MLIYASLLVALIGLLMHALSANSKLSDIGLVAFGCGLLAFLLRVTEAAISVLR